MNSGIRLTSPLNSQTTSATLTIPSDQLLPQCPNNTGLTGRHPANVNVFKNSRLALNSQKKLNATPPFFGGGAFVFLCGSFHHSLQKSAQLVACWAELCRQDEDRVTCTGPARAHFDSHQTQSRGDSLPCFLHGCWIKDLGKAPVLLRCNFKKAIPLQIQIPSHAFPMGPKPPTYYRVTIPYQWVIFFFRLKAEYYASLFPNFVKY